MKTEEIIEKLKDWSVVITMPANDWIDFGIITQKIEEITGISANGKKQVKALESLEKLIWMAAKEYYQK